ncbi:DUF4381 domain-containing protein [uncultured Paraglaciecola sp.]|uniref:DUF4381 domain-containing protein n=1 Tax=uncultured Paraglaciecola sp. TaxID=1765024 RepID=UPI0030D9FD0C|tara:strand:- start:93244 stop:93747 length:504 start_codon:yes stop_codon:yes gene_type:complete
MNPLQDLKDIHTPAAIENWPPAYGWWLLGIIIVVVLGLLIFWLVKARKESLAKRQALKSLHQIDASNPHSVSQLNQLLKRVAMTYFPSQNVQQMHGSQWTNFLINTLPNKKAKVFSDSFEAMQQTLYQAQNSGNTDYPRYCESVETWIKHALPPRKHVLPPLEQNNA